MTDEQLQQRLDTAYRQRDMWEKSYKATGSYSARCNMEKQEERIEKLETERLKRQGAIA